MLRRLLLAITFLTIPVIASIYIPADEFLLAGVASVAVPFFIACCGIALVYFLVKRSAWAWLPAGVLLFFFIRVQGLFSIGAWTGTKGQTPHARIISYNVKALGYYTRGSNYPENFAALSSWLGREQPDIVCLQETVPTHFNSVLPSYSRYFSGKETREKDSLGLFIISRFPIIASGKLEFAFNSFNRLIWADVVINTDTIKIINVHLKSYNFDKTSRLNKYKSIRSALIARSYHAKLIRKFIERSHYKVILCGDFNETPHSYVYQALSESMNNAYEDAGLGYAYSYRFIGMPVRIDHIFADPAIAFVHYRTHDEVTLSDHFPIETSIVLPASD
jgi:endonuclease/exonuclease/phosphatase family metal-dependent hydrolase